MEKPSIRLRITDKMSYEDRMERYKFFVRHFGFELYMQICKSDLISSEDRLSITLEDCIEYAKNKVKQSAILDGSIDAEIICSEDDIHNFLQSNASKGL